MIGVFKRRIRSPSMVKTSIFEQTFMSNNKTHPQEKSSDFSTIVLPAEGFDSLLAAVGVVAVVSACSFVAIWDINIRYNLFKSDHFRWPTYLINLA